MMVISIGLDLRVGLVVLLGNIRVAFELVFIICVINVIAELINCFVGVGVRVWEIQAWLIKIISMALVRVTKVMTNVIIVYVGDTSTWLLGDVGDVPDSIDPLLVGLWIIVLSKIHDPIVDLLLTALIDELVAVLLVGREYSKYIEWRLPIDTTFPQIALICRLDYLKKDLRVGFAQFDCHYYLNILTLLYYNVIRYTMLPLFITITVLNIMWLNISKY